MDTVSKGKTAAPLTELQLAKASVIRARKAQKDMLEASKAIHIIRNDAGVWEVTSTGILTLPEKNSRIPRALTAHLRVKHRTDQHKMIVAGGVLRDAEEQVKLLEEQEKEKTK